MAKTVTVTAGSVTVKQIGANNPDGSPAVEQWTGAPDQIEKHLTFFNAQTQKIAAGDVTAIRDASDAFKLEASKVK